MGVNVRDDSREDRVRGVADPATEQRVPAALVTPAGRRPAAHDTWGVPAARRGNNVSDGRLSRMAARSADCFERFTVFKPPALPEVTDSPILGPAKIRGRISEIGHQGLQMVFGED